MLVVAGVVVNDPIGETSSLKPKAAGFQFERRVYMGFVFVSLRRDASPAGTFFLGTF
jgi:hypothetical protein